jgi:hypothetical protein
MTAVVETANVKTDRDDEESIDASDPPGKQVSN